MPNIHPLIVHFPIALFVVAVVCEMLAYFRKSEIFSRLALITAVTTAVGAVAAVVTGLLAEEIVPKIGEVHTALESHETLGYLVFASAVVFVSLKVVSYFFKTDRLLVAQLMVGFAGVVITFMAAYEGGELVYKHGVGVVRSQAITPAASDTLREMGAKEIRFFRCGES